MYNNNLDTLDASDQMMLPHIKLPLWFEEKNYTPNTLTTFSPRPHPQKQKKRTKTTQSLLQNL